MILRRKEWFLNFGRQLRRNQTELASIGQCRGKEKPAVVVIGLSRVVVKCFAGYSAFEFIELLLEFFRSCQVYFD